MTNKEPKRLIRVIVHGLNQYRAGLIWLAEHGGPGKLWTAPPLWPNKSRTQWWSNAYNGEYYFWFKNEQTRIMFLLALPPPTVFQL